jgi:Bacteriophage related domain of unknown function
MSQSNIRIALETRVKAMVPLIKTVEEDQVYTPEKDVPYQQIHINFAKPANPTLGDGYYRERGYLQLTLRYPHNKGAGAIEDQTELLKQWFPRGLSLTANGVTTVIYETPDVSKAPSEGDRTIRIVKIPFWAEIFGA